MSLRILVTGALFASTSLALLLACSSDDRPTLGAPQQDDADSDASSPPPGAPEDAGADASSDLTDEPVQCDASPCATALTAGRRHLCARMGDGTVRCWGDNTSGAIGVALEADPDGGSADGGIAPVPGLTGVTQISAAGNTTCALLENGSVHCWGANDKAQLGLDPADAATDRDAHPTPSPVVLPERATRVDVMPTGACARLVSGGVACWGSNRGSAWQLLARSSLPNATYGGPGGADRLTSLSPVRIGGSDVTRFALTAEGKLALWGTVSGRPSSIGTSPEPVPLPSLSGITDFAFATTHNCALAEGIISCWTNNGSSSPALCTGLFGRTSALPSPAPTLSTMTGGRPQRIAISPNATCARLTDGTVQCCGLDTFGQLGTGTVSQRALALRPASAFHDYAVHVVTTEQTTCALTRGGSVQCWGSNSRGELGAGTRDDEPHPTPTTVAF